MHTKIRRIVRGLAKIIADLWYSVGIRHEFVASFVLRIYIYIYIYTHIYIYIY